jgi:seryl-tRNA synthetase
MCIIMICQRSFYIGRVDRMRKIFLSIKYMIDIKHLSENSTIYANELKKRGKNPDLAIQTKEKHQEWKKIQSELELRRKDKNDFNQRISSLTVEEKPGELTKMKILSETIKNLEEQSTLLYGEYESFLAQIPNPTWHGIPVGPDDSSNVETAIVGIKPKFGFEPNNYYDLPVFKRDYLGGKGVEAAGFRGYYIVGELAKFQHVLFNWTLDRLLAKGFEFVLPPLMVNEQVMEGTGFFPSGREDVFEVTNGDKTKFLVGTSEAQLMFLESGKTLELTEPRRLTAWTTCFRKEVGTYGKDTKGGIRVHQFEKVETVYLCRPDQTQKVFDEMTNIFHETLNELGLYYHDLEVSSGDISLKNHRQIDIEAWFPAQQAFRELCSSSICTDYQTRNLGIKCYDQHGNIVLAHSLNCTGITNRTMFAIMEQFQDEAGRVKIPSVLIEQFGKALLE